MRCCCTRHRALCWCPWGIWWDCLRTWSFCIRKTCWSKLRTRTFSWRWNWLGRCRNCWNRRCYIGRSWEWNPTILRNWLKWDSRWRLKLLHWCRFIQVMQKVGTSWRNCILWCCCGCGPWYECIRIKWPQGVCLWHFCRFSPMNWAHKWPMVLFYSIQGVDLMQGDVIVCDRFRRCWNLWFGWWCPLFRKFWIVQVW